MCAPSVRVQTAFEGTETEASPDEMAGSWTDELDDKDVAMLAAFSLESFATIGSCEVCSKMVGEDDERYTLCKGKVGYLPWNENALNTTCELDSRMGWVFYERTESLRLLCRKRMGHETMQSVEEPESHGRLVEPSESRVGRSLGNIRVAENSTD